MFKNISAKYPGKYRILRAKTTPVHYRWEKELLGIADTEQEARTFAQRYRGQSGHYIVQDPDGKDVAWMDAYNAAGRIATAGKAFTWTYPGRTTRILTPVQVNRSNYTAMWDTGAVYSRITQEMVEFLDLEPKGSTPRQSAFSTVTYKHPVFSVTIGLPFGVILTDWPVYSDLKKSPEPFQVILGMDILSLGDFAISNQRGKTVFTFRMPSLERIDFCQDEPTAEIRN